MSESDKVEVKDGLLRSLDDPTKWPIQVSPTKTSPTGGWKTCLVYTKGSKTFACFCILYNRNGGFEICYSV